MATVKCNVCGFSADSGQFIASPSYHHDLRCPQCRTTDLDTSDINREWAAEGLRYGYGDDNTLQPPTTGGGRAGLTSPRTVATADGSAC